MISKKITNLIDAKAKELNKDAFDHANEVSLIIKQLNEHINEVISLSEEKIEILLDYLVDCFTIPLDIPLDKNTKIISALGRLNKQGHSIKINWTQRK